MGYLSKHSLSNICCLDGHVPVGQGSRPTPQPSSSGCLAAACNCRPGCSSRLGRGGVCFPDHELVPGCRPPFLFTWASLLSGPRHDICPTGARTGEEAERVGAERSPSLLDPSRRSVTSHFCCGSFDRVESLKEGYTGCGCPEVRTVGSRSRPACLAPDLLPFLPSGSAFRVR